jgi:hypothetical protein
MRTHEVVRSYLARLLKVLDDHAVSLCAGLLGWILGGRFVLWLLQGAVSASVFAQLADSSLLLYGSQGAAAITLFVIAERYL